MIQCLPQSISCHDSSSAPCVVSSLSMTQTSSSTFSSIDPLMTPDLGYGIITALALAGFATYLQSLRSQNDFILAPPVVDDTLESASKNATAFEDWKDISRPENFVLFKKRTKKNQASPIEQRWVLFALLVLFAPIFSFEFFLTVSRQLLCAWNHDFCEAYFN